MSIIQVLKGVNFNNPALPIIGQFATENGLLAAFRPANSAASLIDLSGNGTVLTAIGSPSFTASGMFGDRDNGYITNIAETASLTYLVVARIENVSNSFNAFTIGCYNDDVAGAVTGSGIYSISANGSGAGLLNINNYGVTNYQKTSDNTYVGSLLRATDQITDVSNTSTHTEWRFLAMTIDAATNTIKVYDPKNYPNAAYGTRTFSDGSVATRKRTDANNNPNLIRFMSTPDASTAWRSKVELSEALIYSRALTLDEINKQYQLSKDYMSTIRGISI